MVSTGASKSYDSDEEVEGVVLPVGDGVGLGVHAALRPTGWEQSSCPYLGRHLPGSLRAEDQPYTALLRRDAGEPA